MLKLNNQWYVTMTKEISGIKRKAINMTAIDSITFLNTDPVDFKQPKGCYLIIIFMHYIDAFIVF